MFTIRKKEKRKFNYIDNIIFNELYNSATEISKIISGIIRKIEV